MSLFGTTSSFGTSGTSMFGSTTADNHNPMKVASRASRAARKRCRLAFPTEATVEGEMVWEPTSG